MLIDDGGWGGGGSLLVYYLICEGSLPIHYFLQPMDVINLDEDRQRDETEIKRMAVIFGRKEISRPLTKYEQKMNSAAIEMCLKKTRISSKIQTRKDGCCSSEDHG